MVVTVLNQCSCYEAKRWLWSKLAALLNEAQLRGVVLSAVMLLWRYASFIDEWWHQMSSLVRLHSLLKYVEAKCNWHMNCHDGCVAFMNLFSLCISLSICYQGRSRVKCAHLYNGYCCMAALEGRSSGMALQ